MNERIQKLADEAGLYVDLYGKPWPKSMSAEECNAAYQKFAELIVKETMQVVANNLPPNTYLDVADAVIEHFGVEP